MITKGLIKKTLTAGMLALMACTSMSAMAEKQLVYVGPATAIHDYGPNVTGDMDTICHDVVEMYYDVYVNKMYHLGLQTHPSEFVDAKFAWFFGGHDRDISRGVACYTKGRSYGWKGGVLMLLPENPVYGNTPSGSFAQIVCNYPNSPNAGLYNGTLKEDAEGQMVGEYKLGCYEYIDCDPSLYTRQAIPEACKPKEEPCTGVDFNTMTPTPPGCVPVNVPECESTQNNATSRDFKAATGFVLCESDDICAMPDRDIEDSEAREYARSCTYVHEYHHLMDAKTEQGKEYRECTKDGALKFRPRFYHRNSEFKAYGASIRCLEEKKQECSSTECETAMDTRIQDQRDDQAIFR